MLQPQRTTNRLASTAAPRSGAGGGLRYTLIGAGIVSVVVSTLLVQRSLPSRRAERSAPGLHVQVEGLRDSHGELARLWPDYEAIPDGSRTVGKTGNEQDCLAHIDQVWTDMHPLSLRKFVDQQAGE